MTLLSAWREAARLASDLDEPFLVVATAMLSRYRVLPERSRTDQMQPVLRINCDGKASLLPPASRAPAGRP